MCQNVLIISHLPSILDGVQFLNNISHLNMNIAKGGLVPNF
jgi:phosphohistidine phosphatase SixA